VPWKGRASTDCRRPAYSGYRNMRNSRGGKGFLISFEGGDRCGKSTQIALLAKALRKRGVPVRVFREPGGTRLGEGIRKLLLHRHDLKMSPFTEFQLFTTARRKLCEEAVLPFIQRGKGMLILDRFFDSTLAYQGAAGGVDISRFGEYEKESRSGLVPDLTVLLDIPYETAERRGARLAKDRMEKKSRAFHERVRSGYRALARKEPSRFLVLDGTRPVEEIHRRILKALEERLGRL